MRRWACGLVLWVVAGCAASPAVPPRPAGQGAPAAAPASGDEEAAVSAEGAATAPGEEEATAGGPEEPGEDGDDGDGDIDDDVEVAPDAGGGATVAVSPLAGLSDAEIEEKLKQDPASLGSISLGATNAGRLINGVQMPDGEGWQNIDRARAWGTQETVDALARAIREARRQFPDSPPLYIGHISAKHGGPLSPHRSHQAGRDVDISYYLSNTRAGFIRATAKNLDLDRTWAFVRALITETDVELILIDSSVQKLLKDHAAKIGEDRAWLDEVFQYGSRSPRPLIRHARGHANHIHVRFYNPVAQASAARAHGLLAKHGKVQPAAAMASHNYIQHRVRNGQTLAILAKHYGCTVEAIQRANGLKGTFIKAKRVLNIPRPGQSAAPARPAGPPPRLAPPVIPPRRLPPERSATAAQQRGPALDG